MKQIAQWEVKERQAKLWGKNIVVNMAQVVDLEEEDWAVKPSWLWLEMTTSISFTQNLALIDIGANHNLMSYDTWRPH